MACVTWTTILVASSGNCHSPAACYRGNHQGTAGDFWRVIRVMSMYFAATITVVRYADMGLL